jgi:hypothetical protein
MSRALSSLQLHNWRGVSQLSVHKRRGAFVYDLYACGQIMHVNVLELLIYPFHTKAKFVLLCVAGLLQAQHPAEDPVQAMHQKPAMLDFADKQEPLPVLPPQKMHRSRHEP